MNIHNPEPLQFLHRDLSTQSQLGMLLAITDNMMKFLASEGGEDKTELPAEAKLAAETTLLNACNRIDAILGNDARWGLEFQTRLEAFFVENTKLAREIAEKQKILIDETAAKEKAQKEVALEAGTPHNLLRPTLYEMSEGTWVACLGDPSGVQSNIVGTGPTPSAALKNFDLAFVGGLTDGQKELLNENISLDKARPELFGEGDQRRPDDSRNSGIPGA